VNFVPTISARTEAEVIRACHKIGFPLAIKLSSSIISHKTDVGGVVLNVHSNNDAIHAFLKLKKKKGFESVVVQKMVSGTEIIIGGKLDENFGPTILFGMGGIFVETFKDYSLRICPITSRDASEMISSIKGIALLKGTRGQKGTNLKLIQKELLKVSRLLVKEKQIKELDLNPLIATQKSVLAVDARIIV